VIQGFKLIKTTNFDTVISVTDQSKNEYLTDQEIAIITNKIMYKSDVDHDQRLSTI